MKKKSIFKLRQGAYSALLCLIAVCICVGAVTAADLAESKYGLRTDMSFNSISTSSDLTREVLSTLPHAVHAYAVFSDGSEDNQLIALLDRYQAESARFTWSKENLLRNPALLKMASDDMDDAAVSTDCLIIRCEETGRTRVLTGADYVAYSYDTATGAYGISGWQYEKRLTEAVIYVTMEELPKVQILAGHGELTESETERLEARLRESNYETVRVQPLLGDALDPKAPLMILSPMTDVTEGELDALLAFAQAGGPLFITVSFEDPGAEKLPNLYAFYRLYGFEPLKGVVLADKNQTGTYYDNHTILIPDMLSTDITDPLLQAGADMLLMYGARGFEPLESAQSDLILETVLQSGKGSYLREDASVTLDKQAGDREGPFPVAMAADRSFEGGERSRAFIIGNAAMFLDDYMFDYTYSGELLDNALSYLRGGRAVSVDIAARAAVRPQLAPENNAVPVMLLLLPALIVAVLAIGVLGPRKHL